MWFYIRDLIKPTCIDIINKLNDKWNACAKNIRAAEEVKELVYVRDRMDEWLLERG